MPPKAKLDRDSILEASLDILRRKGYGALNARALASRLGVSTMPLFHYFESMEEIRRATVQKGVEIYNEYMRRGYEHSLPFKGMGMAYIQFAKNEPELFRIFFMAPTEKIAGLPAIDINSSIAVHAAADNLPKGADADKVLTEMWICVHGLATLAVTGKADFSDEEISCMLSDVFLGLKTMANLEDKNG